MDIAGAYLSIFITILQVAYDSNMVEGATDQRTVQILCLFTLSKCHPDHQFGCQNARLNMERLKRHQDESRYMQPSQYCFMDMKNDTSILVDTLLPIVLVSTDRNITCLKNGGVFDGNLKRLLIFTYLDFHLTRVASSILLSKIPVDIYPTLLVSVTDESIYPAFYLENPLAVYSYESALGVQMIQSLSKLKREMGVDYVALLILKDNKTRDQHKKDDKPPCTSDTNDNFMCKFIKDFPDDCVKVLDVNVNDDKQIINAIRLIRRDKITFIFYIGDSQLLAKFRMTAKINKDILHEEAFIEVKEGSLKYLVDSATKNPTKLNSHQFTNSIPAETQQIFFSAKILSSQICFSLGSDTDKTVR